MASKKQIVIISSFSIISGVIAVVLLTVVGALPSAFEVESGARSTNAALVADTSASNGSAIKFQAAQVQSSPCPVASRIVTAGEVTSRVLWRNHGLR